MWIQANSVYNPIGSKLFCNKLNLFSLLSIYHLIQSKNSGRAGGLEDKVPHEYNSLRSNDLRTQVTTSMAECVYNLWVRKQKDTHDIHHSI